MKNIKFPRFQPLILGPLPAEQLRLADLHLADGEVHFSIAAQKHAYKRHPDTYMSCAPFLSETVVNPTHVGQAPHHADNGFELVREMRDEGLIVLIAVVLRPTNRGIYRAMSTYPINRDKLERRVRKRFLIEV